MGLFLYLGTAAHDGQRDGSRAAARVLDAVAALVDLDALDASNKQKASDGPGPPSRETSTRGFTYAKSGGAREDDRGRASRARRRVPDHHRGARAPAVAGC